MIEKLIRRLVLSWKTTALGTGIGGALYIYVRSVLEGAGCNMDQLGLEAWLVAAGPFLAGLLGLDKKQAKESA